MDSSLKINPVIKKKSFYQVLLLRDDKEVKTFKLRNSTLRFLLFSFIFLLFLGFTGLVLGVHTLKKNYDLKDKYKNTSAELSKIRLELEELENVKSLILASKSPLPSAQNDEVSNPNLNATLIKAEENAQSSSATIALSASNSSSKNALSNSSDKSKAEAQAETQVIASLSSDKSPVRINSFNANLSGSSIKIFYDLTNTQQDELVRGSTKYLAVFKNGSTQEINPVETGDSRFAISRMKQMDLRFNIPQELRSKKIEKIKVTVELDSGDAFYEQFDIAK